MAKKGGNFDYNYPLVIKYLQDNGIEYQQYANGQHLKILGDVAYIELWPSRMTYHVIASEGRDDNRYRRLSLYFDEEELEDALNGELGGAEYA